MPIRGRPFVKGQSGNPKGRQKNAETLTGLLRAELEKKNVHDEKGNPVSGKEALVRRLVAMAVRGDPIAIKYIFDRLDGPPIRAFELTGRDGGPLAVQIIDDIPASKA